MERVLRHGKIERTIRVSLSQDSSIEYVLSKRFFKIINLRISNKALDFHGYALSCLFRRQQPLSTQVDIQVLFTP